MNLWIPKYPRTYHLPFSREKHADDKEHQNPQTFLNREIVITEKMDGGAAALSEGQVQARAQGHTTHESFDYIKHVHAWKTRDYPGLVWYGENLAGIHSIEYDALTDFLFLYALRKGDEFLSWDDLQHFSTLTSIPTVPLVFRGVMTRLADLERLIDAEAKKPSAYGVEREGFCVRVADAYPAKLHTEFSAKYVREGHVQTDSHWSKNWQHAKLKG